MKPRLSFSLLAVLAPSTIFISSPGQAGNLPEPTGQTILGAYEIASDYSLKSDSNVPAYFRVDVGSTDISSSGDNYYQFKADASSSSSRAFLYSGNYRDQLTFHHLGNIEFSNFSFTANEFSSGVGGAAINGGYVSFNENGGSLSFLDNTMTNTEFEASGGAINAYSTSFSKNVGNMNFIGNKVIGSLESSAGSASGGALAGRVSFSNNKGDIKFDQNNATGYSTAGGGAFYGMAFVMDGNEGNISFSNNSATATNSLASPGYTLGGAIYSDVVQITNNTNSVSFINNSVSKAGATTYGGAIASLSGSGEIFTIVGNGNVVFAGNTSARASGTLRRMAIFQNSTRVVARLAANEGQSISFYDGNQFNGKLILNGTTDGQNTTASSGTILFSGAAYNTGDGTIISAAGAGATTYFTNAELMGGTLKIQDNAKICSNDSSNTLTIHDGAVLSISAGGRLDWADNTYATASKLVIDGEIQMGVTDASPQGSVSYLNANMYGSGTINVLGGLNHISSIQPNESFNGTLNIKEGGKLSVNTWTSVGNVNLMGGTLTAQKDVKINTLNVSNDTPVNKQTSLIYTDSQDALQLGTLNIRKNAELGVMNTLTVQGNTSIEAGGAISIQSGANLKTTGKLVSEEVSEISGGIDISNGGTWNANGGFDIYHVDARTGTLTIGSDSVIREQGYFYAENTVCGTDAAGNLLTSESAVENRPVLTISKGASLWAGNTVKHASTDGMDPQYETQTGFSNITLKINNEATIGTFVVKGDGDGIVSHEKIVESIKSTFIVDGEDKRTYQYILKEGITYSSGAKVVESNETIVLQTDSVAQIGETSGKLINQGGDLKVDQINTTGTVTASGGVTDLQNATSSSHPELSLGSFGSISSAETAAQIRLNEDITGNTVVKLDTIKAHAGETTVINATTTIEGSALKVDTSGTTLVNNGKINATVTAGDGSTIKGSGIFNNGLTMSQGSTLIIGNSPGRVVMNGISEIDASQAVFSIDGATMASGDSHGWGSGTYSNILVESGTFTWLGNTQLTLEMSSAYDPEPGTALTFDLMRFLVTDKDGQNGVTAILIGTTDLLATGNGTIDGVTIAFSDQSSVDGINLASRIKDMQLTYTTTESLEGKYITVTLNGMASIPEPITPVFSIIALAGILVRRKRS